MGDDKWREVDKHLNSIKWALCNPDARPGGHTHRRSEPNVKVIKEALPHDMSRTNEPKTAPVQPEDFVLEWSHHANQTSQSIANHNPPVDITELMEGLESLEIAKQPQNGGFPAWKMNNHASVSTPPSYSDSKTGTKSTPGSGAASPFLPRANSPSLKTLNPPYHSPSTPPSVPGRPMFPNYNTSYPSPKTTRRSSAPGTDPRTHMVANQIHRSTSHSSAVMPAILQDTETPFKSLRSSEMVPSPLSIPSTQFLVTPTAENVENSNDDEEYTKVLLQHQRERMERLKKELSAKKNLLDSLTNSVKDKENRVIQKKNEKGNANMPTLHDIVKLREQNRRMEIDCNCMIKEVESAKLGHSITRNFHDSIRKKNPPQPLPPPPLPPPPSPPTNEGESGWICTYCTFLNHSALTKCEMCEYRRETRSRSRHQ